MTAPTVGQKMAQSRRWLLWRYSYQAGDKKPRKVPFYANGRARGKHEGPDGEVVSINLDTPEDVAQLVSYDEARRAVEDNPNRFAGVGFALGPDGTGNNWQGIDFDGMKDHPHLAQLSASMVGYRETSPSGDGIHWIGYGPSLFPNMPQVAGVEAYSHGRFFTWTGRDAVDHQLVDLGPVVQQYLVPLRPVREQAPDPKEDFFRVHVKETVSLEQLSEMLDNINISTLPYYEWFQVLAGVHHQFHGTPEEQAAFAMVDQWSGRDNRPGNYPGTRAVAKKWASFGKNPNMCKPGAAITIKTVRQMSGTGYDPADMMERIKAMFSKKQSENEPRASLFGAMSAHEFVTSGTHSAGWLIKGVLPAQGLAQIYGQPGCGKTFAVIDAAFHIARGEPWRGRKTRMGHVVYLAAEGVSGVRRRFQAYAQYHGLDLEDLPITVLTVAPNIMDDDNFLALAMELVAMGRIDMIIVDTLMQTMPGGNENTSEGMGLAIARYTKLAIGLHTMVALIHHSGKDTDKGQRGWSGQAGAMDTQMEVSVAAGDMRVIKTTKQKDGETGEAFAFKLHVVGLGLDDDGDEITSCVALPMGADGKALPDGKPLPDPYAKLGEWERRVMRHIGPHLTMGIPLVSADVIQAIADQYPPDPDKKRDRTKDSIHRAMRSLVDKKFLMLAGFNILPYDQTPRPVQVPHRDDPI